MKSKNRLLTCGLCLLLSLFCIFCLMACDMGGGDKNDNDTGEEEEECTHEWGEWVTTEVPTCVEDGEIERTCILCDEVETDTVPASHTPMTDDGDCTTAILCLSCGEVLTEARDEHTGGIATCVTRARCEVCNKEYGDFSGHASEADDGDCTTEVLCATCGTVTIPANSEHSGGTATCTEKARCAACGMEYGVAWGHMPNLDDGDCTTAITCAVCGEVTTEANAEHTGGTATCTEIAVCQVCGIHYGDYGEHTPEEDDGDCTTEIICSSCGEVTTEANSEHTPEEDDGDCTTDIVCSDCGIVLETGNSEHTGGVATCTEKAVCEICGTEYGEMLPHAAEDDGDCTTEVTCDACGTVVTPASDGHTGGEATCKNLAQCVNCGTEYGELLPHEGEEIWVKRLSTHYRAYSCCYTPVTEAQEHMMAGGACTECGFRPTIDITSAEVNPGDTQIRVAISIKDNPGIAGLQLTLKYDESAFTLVSAENGTALDVLAFTSPGSLTSGCKFLWDGLEVQDKFIKDGEILVLTFDVSSEALAGEYRLVFTINAYDNDLSPFALVIEGGKLTVINN